MLLLNNLLTITNFVVGVLAVLLRYVHKTVLALKTNLAPKKKLATNVFGTNKIFLAPTKVLAPKKFLAITNFVVGVLAVLLKYVHRIICQGCRRN